MSPWGWLCQHAHVEVYGEGPGPFASLGIWAAAVGASVGWAGRSGTGFDWGISFDLWKRGETYEETFRLLVLEVMAPWGRANCGLTVERPRRKRS